MELGKKSRIFVVDASDPENLKFHEIIDDVFHDFRGLVWINNDIIASKTGLPFIDFVNEQVLLN